MPAKIILVDENDNIIGLKVTRERVRQLEQKALIELYDKAKKTGLYDLYTGKIKYANNY